MVTWWNDKYGKDSLCGISRSRLRPGIDKNGYPISVKLPCGHCFYRKAIVEWAKRFTNNIEYKSYPTCPLCRIEFYIEE